MAKAMGRRCALAILVGLTAVVIAEQQQEDSGAKAANFGVSVMLLGSIGFMMGLFYLTNQKDKDMRLYSWQVISSTISIFCAVLLFQGVNGVVEEVLLEGASSRMVLFVNFAHFFVWLGILQIVLAYVCQAIGKKDPSKHINLEDVELNLKCWAVLLGHITGFAAINAFGILQHQVPRTWITTLLIAPFAWLVIGSLGRVTDTIRERVALGDDGIKDELETKWDDETEETEDDVIGLAVSFIAAQSVRFMVGGRLPNPEGEESEATRAGHSFYQIGLLIGIGICCMVFDILRERLFSQKVEYKEGEKGGAENSENEVLRRLRAQMRNVVAMCFAWSIYFSADWLIAGHFYVTEQLMMQQVVLALFVTTFTFGMIFLLDKIADSDQTDEDTDQKIRACVQGLGILIGFSWEKSFDFAVIEVATNIHVMPQAQTKLILAIVLSAVVVPAWRIHILPTIVKLEEEFEEHEKEKEERHEKEEHAEHKKLEAGSLAKPLLEDHKACHGNSPEAKTNGREAPRGLADSENVEVAELRRKCADYHSQVQDLKSRNGELEDSLESINGELAELQKLANLLVN